MSIIIKKIAFYLVCLLSTTSIHANDSIAAPRTEESEPFHLLKLPVDMQDKIISFANKADLDALAESSKYGRILVTKSNRDELCLMITSKNTNDLKSEMFQRASSIEFNLPDDQLVNTVSRILLESDPKILTHIKHLRIKCQNPTAKLIFNLASILHQAQLSNIEDIDITVDHSAWISSNIPFRPAPYLSLLYYNDEDGKKVNCIIINFNVENQNAFIRSPLMNQITDLSLSDPRPDLQKKLELVELNSPSLANLTFSISGDDQLLDFLNSPLAKTGINIHLSVRDISHMGAKALADAPLINLNKLSLYGLIDSDVDLILQSQNFPKLDGLVLGDITITPNTFQNLIKLGNAANLTSLCLHTGGVTDDNLKVLAQSPFMKKIQYLVVSGSHGHNITNEGIQAIAESENLIDLKELQLDNIGLDNTGIGLIMYSTKLRNLTDLHIQGNSMTDAAADIILAAPKFQELRYFVFSNPNGPANLSEEATQKIRAFYPFIHG